MKTIGHRIQELIHHYRLNKNSFSKKIGLTNNTVIGRIVNNPYDRTPSYDVLLMIANTFPEVDTNWLLTGEGSMLRSESTEKGVYDLYAKSIPYFSKPLRFSDSEGGAITMESNERMVIPGAGRGDIALSVYASNMAPLFHSGDIIVCREVKADSIIIMSEVYLFANKQTQFIKRVVSAEEDLIIISDDINPNNRMTIKRSDHPYVWQVLFVVSRISM